MCKELPVILVNKVVDPKRIIGKKWRAEEEERHKGSLTQKVPFLSLLYIAPILPSQFLYKLRRNVYIPANV
jgi:hypothetical protein